MKISYSFGIIDILHYGHMKMLLSAKKEADLHVFGLVDDEAAFNWLGTLISNYTERYQVLEQVACIDQIMPQKSLDPIENLKRLHEKYPAAMITLYHGNDWKIMPAEEYLKSIGGRVVFTEYYKKMAPDNILKILNEQTVENHPNSNLISTKANTLQALQCRLKKSYIEEMMIVSVGELLNSPQQIVHNIQNQFQGKKIVVRSSSSNEDCFESSNAGHYESVLDINSSDEKNVLSALQEVVDSYKRDLDDITLEQILIQRQTEDVCVSGVLFTRDIDANRPYYLINYDETGSTDSVTSGSGGQTVWIVKDIPFEQMEQRWRQLLEAVREIETFLEGMILDIEFAINNKNQVIIFQVRPLAANYRFNKKTADSDFFQLRDTMKTAYQASINSVTGNPFLLSDMAFWNPSEIIGDNPGNLDYSLYREIITKKAWNEGLVPMGYRKVPYELMYKVANKPYISIEYSFLSLMPAVLEEELVNKLLAYYTKKLKCDLTAHDKIEFEIVYSCFDFETRERLQELLDDGFTLEETDKITEALFALTNKALIDYPKVLKEDLESLAILKEKRERIERKLPFEERNIRHLLSYFESLLRDIRKYGTPQFSRQARYAFMSKAFCYTLVSKGYFTQMEMDAFMTSITTVAKDFERDFIKYCKDEMSKADFNIKYGHLRSGTYDIRTDRYDKIHFNKMVIPVNHYEKIQNDAALDPDKLKRALTDTGFDLQADEFKQFLKKSLEQREAFKFEFTKSLSLALEVLISLGENLSIDRELLSYLEISDILAAEYYEPEKVLKDFWTILLEQRRNRHAELSRLILPDVIVNSASIDFVKFGNSRPNFITSEVVEGDVILLETNTDADISGKIVVISKADPGYDWIFTKGIIGLITQYGGVASHMAIRCAEFSIPAAIGCGKKVFAEVMQVKSLKLDCQDKRLILTGERV